MSNKSRTHLSKNSSNNKKNKSSDSIDDSGKQSSFSLFFSKGLSFAVLFVFFGGLLLFSFREDLLGPYIGTASLGGLMSEAHDGFTFFELGNNPIGFSITGLDMFKSDYWIALVALMVLLVFVLLSVSVLNLHDVSNLNKVNKHMVLSPKDIKTFSEPLVLNPVISSSKPKIKAASPGLNLDLDMDIVASKPKLNRFSFPNVYKKKSIIIHSGLKPKEKDRLVSYISKKDKELLKEEDFLKKQLEDLE